VSARHDSRLHRRSQPATFVIVREQPIQSVVEFARRPEINNRIAIIPENLAMFVCVFGEHAATHRGQLEGAHRVSVTIGSANQTERDFRTSDRLPECAQIGVTAGESSGLGVTIPVPTVQGQANAPSDHLRQVGNAIRIGTARKYYIGAKLVAFRRIARGLVKVQGWFISEWQVRESAASVRFEICHIRAPWRENVVVMSQRIHEPRALVTSVPRIVRQIVQPHYAQVSEVCQGGFIDRSESCGYHPVRSMCPTRFNYTSTECMEPVWSMPAHPPIGFGHKRVPPVGFLRNQLYDLMAQLASRRNEVRPNVSLTGVPNHDQFRRSE